MRTPLWDSILTHSVEIWQFRNQTGPSAEYEEIISRLIEGGGSFAVGGGKLWLSQYSVTIYAQAVEELTTGGLTARLVAQPTGKG